MKWLEQMQCVGCLLILMMMRFFGCFVVGSCRHPGSGTDTDGHHRRGLSGAPRYDEATMGPRFDFALFGFFWFQSNRVGRISSRQYPGRAITLKADWPVASTWQVVTSTWWEILRGPSEDLESWMHSLR
jgi:hypothetical protein